MATVTKSAQGPPTRHILASQGPSNHPLNFYSTTYSVKHGRRLTFPQTKSYQKGGTGYIANFRPTVYYNRQVDLTDNPVVANLIQTNYSTLSSLDYAPFQRFTGFEQLPSSLRHGASGFTNNHPMTRTTSDHHISSRTSYRLGYPQKTFRNDSLNPSNYSKKEISGFSHSINDEPITHRPTECHTGVGSTIRRPTEDSLMKRDYFCTNPLTGRESVPILTANSNRSNGYIKGNHYPALAQPNDTKELAVEELNQLVIETKRKKDPALFSRITNPHQYTAYSKVIYGPQNIHPYNKKDAEIGKKELSGYSDNTLFHVIDTNPFHQTTSSKDNYQYPPFHQQSPNTAGRQTLPNGYTKSTQVHNYGQHNPTKILRNSEVYVAKSILAKDPCFVDLTYRNKERT